VIALPPGRLALLDRPPRHLFFTGKGGVGKTSIACAVSLALADAGRSVLLVSTDPASNLDEMLGARLADRPSAVPGADRLAAMNIDPGRAADAYRARVLAQMGDGATARERDEVREQLSGACTTEIAAFDEFVGLLAGDEAGYDHIVLDTAPTGHTLLLMDATGAYHRQMTRELAPKPGSGRIVTPLMRQQDPAYTHVVIVTLPETTPVTEAAALQEDLRRARIEPFAWVVNRSLAAAGTRDKLLRRRLAGELAQIERVRRSLSSNVFVLPWQPSPPVGFAALAALAA